MFKPEEMICADVVITEREILCYLLISRKMLPDLSPEYFTGRRRQLFEALSNQWVSGTLDPVVLKGEHSDAIKECLDSEPTSSEHAVNELAEYWKIRATGEMLYGLRDCSSVDEVLAKVQFQAGEIACRKTDNKYNHSQECNRLVAVIEDGHRKKKEVPGYSTGLTELDKHIGGIEKGKMYAIGALKKTGKSRFAIYLSIKLKEAGAGIFWNSLEMNPLQLNACALSHFMQVDSRIFGKELSAKEYEKLHPGINGVFSLDWVIAKEKTIRSLRSRLLVERAKKNIDVVFVDFIQRMEEPELRKDRVHEVDHIAKGLADLSRELNVGMVVLSQLSGAAEKLGDDEMPNMSHFKESQGIPENADCIITLHNFLRRENPFTDDGGYKLQEIHTFIEQRYGFSGCQFKFLADMQTCTMKNHEDPYGK
jgi:KaiC/GvpD/RAD55 family RecA-like ATPase